METYESSNFLPPEKLFFYIALFYGFLFIFIIPPLQMPDEEQHIKKAYAVSRLELAPEQNASGELGNYLPKVLIDFENAYRSMMGNLSAKYHYDTLIEWGYLRTINHNDTIFCNYNPAQSQANPIMYLPQSTGMAIGTAILSFAGKISPLDLVIFGRLFNLLFFLGIGYLSLKLIPFMKHALFLILTLPMTLTLASSLSYDVMTIGISTLTVSLLFHYAYDSKLLKLSRIDILILCICAVILIECKQVYYPLLMLFIAIPTERFQSLKQKRVFFLTVAFSGILIYAMWILILNLKYPIPVPETFYQSLQRKQIEFLIQNPFKYFKIFLNTFQKQSDFYITSFIGSLGQLDTSFPRAFVVLMFIFIFIVALADTDRVGVRTGTRVLSFLVFIVMLFIVETAIYITWTPMPNVGSVGNPIIEGVQGRYFIPVAILMLASLTLPEMENKVIESVRAGIVGMVPFISLCSLSITVFIIIFRYYI